MTPCSSQLNLANAITIARILLIPVFLVLLLSGLPEPYGDIAAAAVFILAAATDKLDGYVARRSKQITTLGQFLDPLADKLLIAAALIALVSQDRVAAWVAMVIIGREIAVSVLRIVGVSQGVSIPADKYGKLKTVLQIVYVVYVLVPTADIAELIHVSTDVAIVIQWILAVVVVIVTLAQRRALLHERARVIRMPGSQRHRCHRAAPRAAVVLSGNELLDGRTRDTNGAFVSADLSGRGVKVTSLLTVADDADRLTAALRYALAAEPDLLVVGGGSGHHARRPHRRVSRARRWASRSGKTRPRSPCVEEQRARRRRAPSPGLREIFCRWRAARPGCPAGTTPCRRPAWRPASPRAAGARASSRYPGVPSRVRGDVAGSRRGVSRARASSPMSSARSCASSASASCRSAPLLDARAARSRSSWASTSAGER